jgi:hypothetical protein
MAAALQRFRQEYPVKVYQLMAILLAITTTWAVGIVGVVSYLADRDEQYDADQVARCEVSVEARRDLRGVILGIYDVIEEGGPSDTVQRLRSELEITYPQTSIEGCLAAFTAHRPS